MVARPVFVEIIAKTNMKENQFAVAPFEMRGRNGRSIIANEETLICHCDDSGKCVISGCVQTSVPAALLRLKSLHLFIPAEGRDLTVCEIPRNLNEVSFQNDHLSPVTVRILDGTEAAVYHIV